MKAKILGLLAVGLLAGPMAAKAAVITYDFSASNFTSLVPNVPSPYSTLSGSFSLDGSSLVGFDLSIGAKNYTLSDVSLGTVGSDNIIYAGADTGVNAGTNDFWLRFTPQFAFFDLVFSEVGAQTTWASRTGTITQRVQSVPEPGTLALLGLGLVGLGLSRRRKAD